MRIRTMQTGDRDEWLRLLHALYPDSVESDHSPSVDAFLSRTGHDELLPSEVFACERDGGGLGGFLELSVRNYAEACTGETPYVESWYVDSDLRGRGAGRLLLQAAEQWARERGYRELASDTEVSNEASQHAHAALGFEAVERAVHFRKPL
jgi:aminoglycoside 6'-N-acetyltransferase I